MMRMKTSRSREKSAFQFQIWCLFMLSTFRGENQIQFYWYCNNEASDSKHIENAKQLLYSNLRMPRDT
ncbi:hypothetical protein PsorP6_017073 [Peronosclerospora sorghi]|uniref:Uncharacterized protein n=1 Tax=Peronosclerospora sorghi TaxID=230839 RepID=A0ACC0WDD5_9STRA|nr:hypothetical protein PsorP6_017073 [Peronosclerospora sorghi]